MGDLRTVASPGKRYFICGTSGHCSQGMKLQVDTVAASVPSTSPTPSPSAKAPTPSPSKTSPSASPSDEISPTSSAIPPSETSPGPSGTAPVPSPSAADGGCSSMKLALEFGFGLVMLLAR